LGPSRLPHVNYLKGLIEAGKIRASGPVTSLGKRAGFIIMTVTDLEEAKRLINEDPFTIEGLIDKLTILQWDPMFGAFSGERTRKSN
jgi:uncharacterized protein